MRNKLMTLSLLSILTLSACAADEEQVETTPEAEESTEQVEETEAEEVEEEETTDSDVGKRSSPVPLGDTVTYTDSFYDDNYDEKFDALFELRISDVTRGQEAYDILLGENQFNEPAPEGMEWLIISLEGELIEGDEDNPYTIVPWFDIVDSSGSEVSQDDYGTLDGNEYGYVDLFPGGTNSGRITLYGPENDDSLLALDTSEGKVYFSLTE